MKRTKHPIFKEIEMRDADDELLESDSGVADAIPNFVDRMLKIKKGDEEDESA